MFLLIIFALVSAFRVIQISDVNQQYIEEVTQSQFNETYVFLTHGWADYYYFSITLSTIYESVSVALAVSQIQAPHFDSSNKLIYQQFDSNGYLLKRQYLYLILTESILPYYITILSEKQISYKIQAYNKIVKPCSESCSLLGSCQVGECICRAGWIGDDCTISAIQITNELTIYKSGYFYQEFKEQESINFDITSFQDGNIYFLFQATQISVPTTEAFDFKLELQAKVPQKFSLQYPESGEHKIIIYVPSSVKVKFVSNSQDESTTPNYDDSNNSDSTLSSDSVILICTIVPLLMMVLITVVICVKCRIKQFICRMANNPQQIVPYIAPNHENQPIVFGAEFPRVEGECCICLGGLNNPLNFKRTPCNHKFHQSCIQEWIFTGHAECPLCRAKITMNSLF